MHHSKIILAALPASIYICSCNAPATTAPPTLTITADPVTITAGQSSTLTWSSKNAGSCTASDAWNGSKSISGTESITPSTLGTMAYTLTCIGASGTTTSSAMLTVNALPLSITTPPGFTANYEILRQNGPLIFTNFNNKYLEGGIAPDNGAEIDVASEVLPPPPLSNLVDVELSGEGATVISSSTVIVSGISCIQKNFTTIDTAVVTKNEAVYCPSRILLYKFFLSYYSDDPNESQYLSIFQRILGDAQFPP